MRPYWDVVIYVCVLSSIAAGLLAWLVSYGLMEWESIVEQFKLWLKSKHTTPIYGPADLYRLKGPQAKQNFRVVR